MNNPLQEAFDHWWSRETAPLRMRYGVLLPSDKLTFEEASKLAYAAWREAAEQAIREKLLERI